MTEIKNKELKEALIRLADAFEIAGEKANEELIIKTVQYIETLEEEIERRDKNEI